MELKTQSTVQDSKSRSGQSDSGNRTAKTNYSAPVGFSIFFQAQIWIRALRLQTLGIPFIQLLLSLSYLLNEHYTIYWPALPLIAGALFFNFAGAIFLSEYNDFKNGLNRRDALSPNGLLIRGLLTPYSFKRYGWIFFLIGGCAVLPLISLRGPGMLVFVLIGFLGGYFYSAEPIGYKYRALGELAVPLLLGPISSMGTIFALSELIEYKILIITIPGALLLAAAIHASNMFNATVRLNTWIRYFALLLTHKQSVRIYMIEITLPYVLVIFLVSISSIPILSTITLLSLPQAFRCLRDIVHAPTESLQDSGGIVEKTVWLYAQFSLLFAISIFLADFT